MKYRTELFETLSRLSGLPEYDEIDITLEENYSRTYRVSIWVRIDGFNYQVHKNNIKGGIEVMKINISQANAPIQEYIPIDHPIDKMFYKKYRTIDEFNVPYTIKKSAYKYDEGGGWYSMQDVYTVAGQQFIMI